MPETNEKYYARAHKKIEELLPILKGETLTREQWYRLCNVNPNNPQHLPFKEAINTVLWNLSQQNKKKKVVKDGNLFKVVDDTLVPIDFTKAGGARFDLVLPFGIHQYCYLYRKNIMIIYGSKDSAKTATCLNITKLNMKKHRILYFSSEMVEDEFAIRLSKDNNLTLNDWKFEPYERSYAFDEVIDPDSLNIIDYLELGGGGTEYYEGVSLIRKVFDKLDKGVAIIACQKNRNAELPKGGSGLLEKARIALSLDPGKITIAVAKNWAEGVETSPRGKAWTYQLIGGINIINPVECFDEP